MNIHSFNTNFIHLFSFCFFLVYFVFRPFLLYQNLLGNIPSFPGIHFGLSILFFGLIISIYFVSPKLVRLNLYDITVYFLILYIFLIIYFDYFLYGKSKFLYDQNIQVVFYYFVFYIVGINFIKIEKYYNTILCCFVVLSIEKLINYDLNLGHIYLKLDEEFNSLYAFLADTFAVLAIVLITLTKRQLYKILLILSSLAVLSALYGRTPFYLMLVISLIMLLKDFSLNYKFMFTIVFTVIIIFLVSTFDLESSRMFHFLLTGEDGSWNARNIQKIFGYQDIKNNWFLGAYAGQFYNYEQTFGSYIHNFLSFYRQFGLLSMLFLTCIFFKIGKNYYLWYKNFYSENMNYIFYLGIFVILEIIISRSYTLPYLFFVFGMFSSVDLMGGEGEKAHEATK